MEINKQEHLFTGYNGGPVTTAEYDDPKIITQEEASEKLRKILKIEEEIGIDLTIFFAALKNGVYYFDEEGQLIHDYVWLVNNYITAGVHDKLSFSFKTVHNGQILLFENYGTDWAVYKQELREEKLDKVEQMTYLQEVLIEGMNEFCAEKFDLSYKRTKEEAEEYITKNIDEYKSLTTHNWY